jgi:hypothetical protein
MLVQFCLKGVAERTTGKSPFSDNEAHRAVDKDGLRASWLRSQSRAGASDSALLFHRVLSQTALDAHVNSISGLGLKRASAARAVPDLGVQRGPRLQQSGVGSMTCLTMYHTRKPQTARGIPHANG